MTAMTGQLRDKIAIVTGGAQGIGAAIVQRFQAEGAKVVTADVTALDAAPGDRGDCVRRSPTRPGSGIGRSNAEHVRAD